jgi:succinate-semialdehyde dehydrogenase/glutarate-semialdehyde dehydrogenase
LKVFILLKDGSVFINEMVRSDSRMPSGGCKDSGFGRECSNYGFEEFANVKAIYIKK